MTESGQHEARHQVALQQLQAEINRRRAKNGWQAEAMVFRANAADRFTASMRQRIDLARIYRRALRGLPKTIDGQPPMAVPDTCPVTLDELLAED